MRYAAVHARRAAAARAAAAGGRRRFARGDAISDAHDLRVLKLGAAVARAWRTAAGRWVKSRVAGAAQPARGPAEAELRKGPLRTGSPVTAVDPGGQTLIGSVQSDTPSRHFQAERARLVSPGPGRQAMNATTPQSRVEGRGVARSGRRATWRLHLRGRGRWLRPPKSSTWRRAARRWCGSAARAAAGSASPGWPATGRGPSAPVLPAADTTTQGEPKGFTWADYRDLIMPRTASWPHPWSGSGITSYPHGPGAGGLRRAEQGLAAHVPAAHIGGHE